MFSISTKLPIRYLLDAVPDKKFDRGNIHRFQRFIIVILVNTESM